MEDAEEDDDDMRVYDLPREKRPLNTDESDSDVEEYSLRRGKRPVPYGMAGVSTIE